MGSILQSDRLYSQSVFRANKQQPRMKLHDNILGINFVYVLLGYCYYVAQCNAQRSLSARKIKVEFYRVSIKNGYASLDWDGGPSSPILVRSGNYMGVI